MKPKFNLGDIVECAFNGEVEGVVVVVRKRLFVSGMAASFGNVSYTVCENDPSKPHVPGRSYSKTEGELIELEPVVQELERTNRKVVPQPAPSLQDHLNRASAMQ